MKLKRIACLALAVMMMAVMAISTSAAGEDIVVKSTTPKAETLTPTAADLGAAYTAGLSVVNSGGWALSPAKFNTTDYLGVGKVDLTVDEPVYKKDSNGNIVPFTLPFVTYKVAADEGYVLDTLNLVLHVNARAYGNNQNYYQIAVYLTTSVELNANGRIDFSKLSPAVVYGGGDQVATPSDVSDGSGANTLQNFDASAALAALGDNLSEVYVTVAINNGWTSGSQVKNDAGEVVDISGFDYSRTRVWSFEATATQKAAPAPETQAPATQAPETQAPATQAPTTQAPSTSDNTPVPPQGDNAILSALALVLVSGLAVAFVARKKR